jgi:transcriptional regulator with XRE-family HTH domain
MTQQELASAIGAAQNTITNYERGIREPDAVRLIAIARALGVTCDYLLDMHIPDRDQLSNKAVAIAEKYDQLDQYGKSLVDLVIDHEAARVAASKPDEFEIARQAIDELNAAALGRPESTG